MKELSIEEKAKRYDEAIERAKGVIEQNPLMEYLKKGIEYILPELKEDKDEEIRKGIISNLEYLMDRAEGFVKDELKERIAWLEKQGEQKPVDKVEPKFYEGEWLCENEPNNYARFIQILETVNVQGKERYRISRDIHNDEDIVKFDFVEKYYHKFDIKDAKDGDVLSFNDGHGNDCIELIKSITDKKIEFWFCLTNGNHYEVFNGITPYTNLVSRENATPATKEQRDLLFQKMEEASYEWDAEKKRLKKIEEEVNGEDYGIDSLYHAQRILEKTLGSVDGYQSDDGILEHKCAITAVKKLYEQKPAWNEDDERKMRYIENELSCLIADEREIESPLTKRVRDLYSALYWFKSLKDRVQPQPKQEWSEKCIADVFEKVGLAKIAREQGYDALTEAIQSAMIELSKFTPQPQQEWSEEDLYKVESALFGTYAADVASKLLNRLKSIRPQNTWKPSDEQMNALEQVYDWYNNNFAPSETLTSLYNDLKKLKE